MRFKEWQCSCVAAKTECAVLVKNTVKPVHAKLGLVSARVQRMRKTWLGDVECPLAIRSVLKEHVALPFRDVVQGNPYVKRRYPLKQ